MKPADDNDSTFREAVRDVKPLKVSDRVPSRKPRPSALAKKTRAARFAILEESMDGLPRSLPSGEMEFSRPGIAASTLRKLRAGHYRIEDELDLHGMTRSAALVELKAFIVESRDARLGCVRIIHGKGSRSGPAGPVLKHAVQEWLARSGDVLAFTTAIPRHGGTGAVYVLLRSR